MTEIAFPIEFIATGTPVSLQAKRSRSRAQWKEHLRLASSGALPVGHFASASPMSVTLFFFPASRMQGDLDNIVKPVLDAFARHIYLDDKQIERIWVQKFEPGRRLPFEQPSETLAEAIKGPKPLLFIRLSDDPNEGLS